MTDLPIQSLDCGSGIKPRKSLDPRREHEEHGGGGRNNKKMWRDSGFHRRELDTWWNCRGVGQW